MTTQNPKALAGAALMALLTASAQAVSSTSPLTPGTRLSVTQKSALALKSVQIGSQAYRVVSSTSGTEPTTTLLDAHDVVGISRNEVVISELATEAAQAAAASLTVKPVSEKPYAHLNMTVLRFATLMEAEQARQQLAATLPQTAKLSVPIKFTQVKPQ